MNSFIQRIASIIGCALFLVTVSLTNFANAAGTITLVNGPLTRVQISQPPAPSPLPTTVSVVFGVFWGTSPNRDELMLVSILVSNSTTTAGIIVAPNPFPIPGTAPGQVVYLQIRAWLASYGLDWRAAQNNGAYLGETEIRQVMLGPESGPGTVIWSTSGSGFRPLILSLPLTPPVFVHFGPSPATLDIDEGDAGVVQAPVTLYRFSSSTGPLDFATSVQIQTENLTAEAGQDYVGTNFVLTFAPGETTRRITVPITGMPGAEPIEQFLVRVTGVGANFQSILTATIRPAQISSVAPESNGVIVTFPTTAHQRYTVESTTDFLSWSSVSGAENVSGTGGALQIIDTGFDCCGYRFYRTRLVPPAP